MPAGGRGAAPRQARTVRTGAAATARVARESDSTEARRRAGASVGTSVAARSTSERHEIRAPGGAYLMTFRASLGSACAVGALLIGLTTRGAAAAESFVFHHENVMGTSLELRVRADSEEVARRAEDRALREIDRLSAIFSAYDPRSEFSRWLAGPRTPVRVAPELFEVLERCDHWRAASGGAFDPRVEMLMRLWSRCAREGRTPTPAETAAAQASMNRPSWRLDSAAMTAERLSDGPLTLNAIAKGYIVERACAAAMDAGGRSGIRGALLNVGGDLRVCGELDRTIGIADPRADSETSAPIASIVVHDRAVS